MTVVMEWFTPYQSAYSLFKLSSRLWPFGPNITRIMAWANPGLSNYLTTTTTPHIYLAGPVGQTRHEPAIHPLPRTEVVSMPTSSQYLLA